MKSILLIISTLLLSLPLYADKPGLFYKTSHLSVVKADNEIHVSFRLKTNKKATKRNDILTLIPTLRDSIHREELSPVYVSGRKGDIIRYRKEKSRDSHKNIWSFKTKNNNEIQYFVIIPYASWMEKATLSMDILYETCCKTIVYPPEILLDQLQIQNNFRPWFSIASIEQAFLHTGSELCKWEFEVYPQINFEQGKWNIDPAYMNNMISLDDINDALHEIIANKNNHISCIEIIGLSSPEGNTLFNSELGEKRAIALKDYLRNEFPELSNKSFLLLNGHENWNGLRELVSESEMPQKQDILYMLNSISPDNGLKEKLKSYQDGYAYMYMVHNYFPRLRNACSLSVFYLTENLSERADFEKVKSYLQDNNYEACLPILERRKGNPELWNLIGVCYLMTNNTKMAEYYFTKAIENGSENAKLNLKYLK